MTGQRRPAAVAERRGSMRNVGLRYRRLQTATGRRVCWAAEAAASFRQFRQRGTAAAEAAES